MSDPNFDLLDNRIRQIVSSIAKEPVEAGGGGPHNGDMDTRIGRLEGTIDGVKHSQNILVMSVMGLAALFVALAGIMVTLQIRTEAKVDALPAQINESVREANRAFADAVNTAIQATRQQPPQVIVVPPQAAPQK